MFGQAVGSAAEYEASLRLLMPPPPPRTPPYRNAALPPVSPPSTQQEPPSTAADGGTPEPDSELRRAMRGALLRLRAIATRWPAHRPAPCITVHACATHGIDRFSSADGRTLNEMLFAETLKPSNELGAPMRERIEAKAVSKLGPLLDYRMAVMSGIGWLDRSQYFERRDALRLQTLAHLNNLNQNMLLHLDGRSPPPDQGNLALDEAIERVAACADLIRRLGTSGLQQQEGSNLAELRDVLVEAKQRSLQAVVGAHGDIAIGSFF